VKKRQAQYDEAKLKREFLRGVEVTELTTAQALRICFVERIAAFWPMGYVMPALRASYPAPDQWRLA
jgi:hypothetical protein